MGWHSDPYGRHQYRFWDGQQWTDRVANGGAETTDPPILGGAATDPGTGPVPGQPPTAWPAETSGSTWTSAPPPRRSAGSRWAVVATAAVVTAALVLVLVFVVFGGNGHKSSSLGSGTGTFTAQVAKGQAKVRTFDVRPGDLVTITWRAREGDAKVNWAVDKATAEKLAGKAGFIQDSDLSDEYDTAQTLLSDASDSGAIFKDATRKHPYVKVDGFEGLVSGDDGYFVSPAGGTFAVIVVGKTKATVKVRVDVKHLPGAKSSDFNTDDYDSFTSGLDSGLIDSELTDQCSNQDQLTDGFCSRYHSGTDSFSDSYSASSGYSDSYGSSS